MALLVRVQPGCVGTVVEHHWLLYGQRGEVKGVGSFFFSFFSLVFSPLFLLASFFSPFFLSILRFLPSPLPSKAHIGYAGSKMFQNPSKLPPPSFS